MRAPRLTTPARAATMLLAVALTLTAAPAAAQQQPVTTKDAPLFANAWIGGPLDSVYSAEYARLQETCENVDTACFEAELDTTAVVLTRVRGSPGGDTVGHLLAALRPRGRYPYATLLYRPVQGPDVVVQEDIGDWGYGVTLPLADRTRGWVRLRVSHADAPLWLPADADDRGFGIVDIYGLTGRLWRLGPVDGTGGDGREVTVPEGVYFVLDVDDDAIRLRPELPTDMPCGEERAAPPGSVTEYSIPLDALEDPDGRLAVELAYPKGC